jgi:hypothetical protein
MVARSDRGFLPHDRALIAALRNAHDAYRACVLALHTAKSVIDELRMRNGDILAVAGEPNIDAALARFTNITEDGA